MLSFIVHYSWLIFLGVMGLIAFSFYCANQIIERRDRKGRIKNRTASLSDYFKDKGIW